MSKFICKNCKQVFEGIDETQCPLCDSEGPGFHNFHNSDRHLKEQVPRIVEDRQKAGLDGLVGGLQAVVINTEPQHLKAAAAEFLKYTGLNFADAFQTPEEEKNIILKRAGSADFILRTRGDNNNPFRELNLCPKSSHLPDTRLETFVFKTPDIEKYVAIQKNRGVEFLTDHIIKKDHYSFIQTKPSIYTGNSLGFIQWNNREGDYFSQDCRKLELNLKKPDSPHLANIFELDHCATRLHAVDRDDAIMEFMYLTNYNFDFAIYVKVFNSITNVARLSADDYAMVFTSGISPYTNDEESGPTEKFIHNYGTRVHHMAFRTENITETYEALQRDGMEFMIELVGNEDEGLRQTFTEPSPHTLLVNEYIQRYGGFDGFFTRSNVTLLTGATDKQ